MTCKREEVGEGGESEGWRGRQRAGEARVGGCKGRDSGSGEGARVLVIPGRGGVRRREATRPRVATGDEKYRKVRPSRSEDLFD